MRKDLRISKPAPPHRSQTATREPKTAIRAALASLDPRPVLVNDRGRRIGETHPRAKVANSDVDLICEMAEEAIAAGRKRAEVYAWLARKFEIHPRTVKKYVYGEARAQVIARAR